MCQTPPIIFAVIKGDLPKVKSLITQGHSVNATDEKGATALHWSCSKGDEKLCEYLLDAGCNVKSRIQNGSTALHVAADHGCVGCTRILIKRGAELDPSNDRCDTPLHTAAYRGHLDIIKLLVHAGANPTLRNKHGLTPLEEASAKSFETCVQYLLPYNTNILLSSNDKEAAKFKDTPNEEKAQSFNIQPESTYYKPVDNVMGDSQIKKLNICNSSVYSSEKLCNDNHSACPSFVSSIDSDYSSYTSDKDVTSFSEMSLPALTEGYASTFESLLSRAVAVESRSGSPMSRMPVSETHSKTAERSIQLVQGSVEPPELPPRPSWLCKPELVSRLSSPGKGQRDNQREKLIGLEVHQFIEQLQERMLVMQEQLVRYETSNAHLRNQVGYLTGENKLLRAENEKLKRQQSVVQAKQCNPYYQSFSEIDEGMHSGSYMINQTHDKLNALSSSIDNNNSMYGSLGSREPVENNELI